MAPTTPLPYDVANHLKSLAFTTIWNEPDNRARANFELTPLKDTVFTSAIDLSFTRLMLPIPGLTYRVFSVGRSVYQGWLMPNAMQWTSTKDLGDTTGSNLVTYDYTGRVINPAQVFMYYIPYGQLIYVAIPNYVMVKSTADATAPIYQTLFRETDMPGNQIFTSLTVSDPVSDLITIQMVIQTIPNGNTDGLVVLQNGKVILTENVNTMTLTNGDQIVLLYDPDVTMTLDVDIDNAKTGYFSDTYSEYRELIHTPKAYNPDHRLLRAEDISMIVYDPTSGSARYLHRLADNFITNVTHQDFSLSRAILNAFRDAMGVSQIYVRVLYRKSDEPRYLTHDVNCIESLYLQDDNSIVALLLGMKDDGVPEWTASNLEKAGYVTLMSSTSNSLDEDMVTTYTGALGWYQTVEMLSQCKATFTYQNADTMVDKPPYLRSKDTDVTVFADGKKVQDFYVSLSQHNTQIIVGFNPGSGVTAGARIDVRMSERHNRAPTSFVPDDQNNTFIVDRMDFTIYKRVTLHAPTRGCAGSYSYSYEEVPVGTGRYSCEPVSSQFVITIDPALYGETLYWAWDVGRDCLYYNIDPLINQKKAIIIAAAYNVDGEAVPLFTKARASVYLNGNRLIPNIDYTDVPLYTDTNGITERPIVVSNLTYLKTSGNVFEIVVDDFTTMFSDVGYNTSGVCKRQLMPWVWLPSCSDVFTRGVLLNQVKDNQHSLLTTNPTQDGSPFYTEVLLDRSIATYMTDHLPSLDVDIRTRADKTIPLNYPPIKLPVIIAQSYVLYSPYLTQIMYDLLTGALEVGLDDSPDKFLSQFSDYDALKARDPVIGNANPNIDRNLLDLSVNYGNWVVNDMTKLRIIDTLCKFLFNNKTPTLGVTLV